MAHDLLPKGALLLQDLLTLGRLFGALVHKAGAIHPGPVGAVSGLEGVLHRGLVVGTQVDALRLLDVVKGKMPSLLGAKYQGREAVALLHCLKTGK